jgi:ABC-type multidrug transport system ATPase subunit
VITISSLSKTYHSKTRVVQALDTVNLEIGTGMFGLLGPNGAGKTTLMRILAGIVNPSQGEVIINGNNLKLNAGKKAVKTMLGYLPQELGMYQELSAYQFIDYMAILKGLDDTQKRAQQVEKTLDMVGLRQEAGRKIKGFSGGMKRRVGIAQALVNDPELLIVDEPTSGLDPEERIRFRNLLVNLSDERTIILSTHIVEDIAQTCQDLAVLSSGQVIFRGSPAGLMQEADGHVWSLTSNSMERPDHGLTVVSMLHLPDGIQYRLVGSSVEEYPTAEAVKPGLEDGYVWLMRSKGQAVDVLS